MIDTPAKLNVLRTSLAGAINRLGSPDALDVHSPPDLRHLLHQFVRSGGRCEELLHLFAEADRPPTPAGNIGAGRGSSFPPESRPHLLLQNPC